MTNARLMYLPHRVFVGGSEYTPGNVDVSVYPELEPYCIPLLTEVSPGVFAVQESQS